MHIAAPLPRRTHGRISRRREQPALGADRLTDGASQRVDLWRFAEHRYEGRKPCPSRYIRPLMHADRGKTNVQT